MKQNTDERKERVMEAWLNNPNETYGAICRIAGVSEVSFYRYRQEPEFMEEYHKRQQQRFKELEGKAMAQLEAQIDRGNFNAVKYVLDGSGYKPTDKVEAKVETTYTVGFDEE